VSILKTDVSILKTDVSALKKDVNQIKVGGIALFGAAALSYIEMKNMEKRSDAKIIAAETKSDKQMLAIEQKMDKMFFVTTAVAVVVPSLITFYSSK
jgi:AICAR transformylase/IMP cyclohydrolase PurH